MESESPPPSPSTIPTPALARHQERKIPNANQKLNRSDQRPDEQTRLKQKSYLSFLTAGPCRKDWCFATSPSQRLTFHDDRTPENQAQQSLSPFLSLSSIGRRTLQPTRTKSLGVRNSLEDGQTSPQGSVIFIDEGTSSLPIQFLKFPRSRSIFWDFRHVKSSRF